MRGLHGLSIGFAAGAIGGLVCSLVIWFSGEIGLTEHYDVSIHPKFTAEWLYPRIVWGGLWGFLFVMPYFERMPLLLKGALLSLLPSAIQLFVIFPIFQHQELMGMRLGDLTPLFVLGFNACWGLAAGLWIRLSRG
jgi:hypothetical protein